MKPRTAKLEHGQVTVPQAVLRSRLFAPRECRRLNRRAALAAGDAKLEGWQTEPIEITSRWLTRGGFSMRTSKLPGWTSASTTRPRPGWTRTGGTPPRGSSTRCTRRTPRIPCRPSTSGDAPVSRPGSMSHSSSAASTSMRRRPRRAFRSASWSGPNGRRGIDWSGERSRVAWAQTSLIRRSRRASAGSHTEAGQSPSCRPQRDPSMARALMR